MIASDILMFCAIIALAMLFAFSVLLIRRWLQQMGEEARRTNLARITRSYLRRVSGQMDTEPQAKSSDEQRLEAVSRLHLLLRGGERHQLMQMAELDGLLRATLKKSRSIRSSRRIDAISLLQQFGSEACIARLREIFARDRKYIVRLEAAFALAAMRALPPPRETIRILRMFERKVKFFDSALLRSSAPDYSEQLAMILDDHLTGDQRALIVDALGWAQNHSILPVIEKASRSDNAEVRSAALRAAARLGNPSAGDWIIGMIGDPVPFVRIQAVNSCAVLGLTEGVSAIRDSLGDPDIWVRLRADHALAKLCEKAPAAALQARLP